MRSNDNHNTARERFDEFLRQNKKRRTAERFAIFDMVAATSGHFTADELRSRMHEKGFHVSVATVYSVLGLLVDFGMIVRQRFGNQACIYERAAASTQSVHHHLICTECGKVKEVRDQAFSRLVETYRFAGFTQSYYTLYIYGMCGACSRRKKKQP